MDDDRLREWLDRWQVRAARDGVMSSVAARRARRRVIRQVQIVLLTAVVLVGSAGVTFALMRVFRVASSISPAGMESRNGLIAFARFPAGPARDIYVVRPDGSHQRPLISGLGIYAEPAWSPDGMRIAFVQGSYPGGPFQILLMNADRTGLTELTHEPGGASQPQWSPDGSRIVFVSARDEPHPTTCHLCNLNLYVINVDGSGLTQLTNMPGIEGDPHWTGDGRGVLFVNAGGHDGMQTPPAKGQHTWLVNADGTGLRRFFGCDYGRHCLDGLNPIVSPDGTRIAYIGPHDFGLAGNVQEEWGFYETDDTGAHPLFVRVCHANVVGCSVLDATWSPDGAHFLFTGQTTSHRFALYVMNVDGTGLRQLPVLDASNPSWQPVPEGEPGAATTPTSSVLEPTSRPPSPSVSNEPCSIYETQVRGDFDGNGQPDVAFVGSTGCLVPNPGPGIQSATPWAIDVIWNGSTETSWPFPDCTEECAAYGAGDIDGNGTAELAVVVGHQGSTQLLEVVELYPNGLLPTRFLIQTPSGPGSPIRLSVGGATTVTFASVPVHSAHLSLLTCRTAASGDQQVIATDAELPSGGAVWTLRETVFGVAEQSFRRESTRTYGEAFDPTGPSPSVPGHVCFTQP